MIPKQLQKSVFRFVKLNGKIPIEFGWQKDNNYKFDDIKLTQYKENLGVATGFGDLIVIDFDNKDFQKEFIERLPKTYTVKSGGGLLHKYFLTDNPTSFKILDKDKNTLCDVQGKGKQIVIEGSIHPNGNVYECVDDCDIVFLPFAEIKALFKDYIKKEDKIERKGIQNKPNLEPTLRKYGVDTSKNPTTCLWHNSKGGKCFSFNEEVYHCFHCEESGDSISFVMKEEGVDFISACKILEIKLERKMTAPEQFMLSKQVLEELFYKDRSKETNRNNATEILAKEYMKDNHVYTTRDDEKSEVWVYHKGIYKPQGKTFIKEFCREVLGKVYSSGICSMVIAKIEVDTYIEQDEFFNNNIVEEIAIQNGILNIFTKILMPFDPKKIFFNKLPIDYDPEMVCPKINKHLETVLANKDDVKVLKEIMGYCLLKEYKIEKGIMFMGSGRNGKGKTIEIIKRFLGVENCASIPLQQLEKDPYGVSELFNKMANLAGDINKNALYQTGRFKELTGRDLVSAQRKFLPRVHFVNYAKLIFSANELPQTHDITPAFFNRWVLIDFPYTFKTQKEIDATKEKDRNKLKLIDPEICEKTTTSDELSGLLNEALDSLTEILRNKDFSVSTTAEDIKTTWIRKSSSFSAFLMDEVTESWESYIIKNELRKQYSLYCMKHKLIPKGDKEIKDTLTTTFGVSESKRSLDGEREMVWNGIIFKKDVVEEIDMSKVSR